MTIPTLEGLGDTLMQVGPQLGDSLKRIFRPNFDTEQELQKLLMRNPDLIDQFASREQESPGSTAMFGPNAQKYFGSRKLSTEFLTKRKLDQLAVKRDEQGLAKGERELKILDQNFSSNAFELAKNEEFMEFTSRLKKEDPKRWRDLMTKKAFGMTEAEYETAELNRKRERLGVEALERAKGLAPFDPRKMNQYSVSDIMSYFSDPSLRAAYGQLFSEHMQDKRQAAMDARAAARDKAISDRQYSRERRAGEAALLRERVNVTNQLGKGNVKNRDELIATLNDIHARLANDFGYEFRKTEWFDETWPTPNRLRTVGFTKEGQAVEVTGQAASGEKISAAIAEAKALPPEERNKWMEQIRKTNPIIAQQIEDGLRADAIDPSDEDEEDPEDPDGVGDIPATDDGTTPTTAVDTTGADIPVGQHTVRDSSITSPVLDSPIAKAGLLEFVTGPNISVRYRLSHKNAGKLTARDIPIYKRLYDQYMGEQMKNPKPISEAPVRKPNSSKAVQDSALAAIERNRRSAAQPLPKLDR